MKRAIFVTAALLALLAGLLGRPGAGFLWLVAVVAALIVLRRTWR